MAFIYIPRVYSDFCSTGPCSVRAHLSASRVTRRARTLSQAALLPFFLRGLACFRLLHRGPSAMISSRIDKRGSDGSSHGLRPERTQQQGEPLPLAAHQPETRTERHKHMSEREIASDQRRKHWLMDIQITVWECVRDLNSSIWRTENRRSDTDLLLNRCLFFIGQIDLYHTIFVFRRKYELEHF